IDAAIAALARYGDVDKTSLPKKPLSEAFEAIWGELQKPGYELVLPRTLCLFLLVCGLRRSAGALFLVPLLDRITPNLGRRLHLGLGHRPAAIGRCPDPPG